MAKRAAALTAFAVRCEGRDCAPEAERARGGRLVAFRRFHRELRSGVLLEVSVTRPGELGKYTSLEVHRGRPPTREDLCLAADGPGPQPCPSPVPAPAEVTTAASREDASRLNAGGYERLRAKRYDSAVRLFVSAAAPADSIQYASSLFGLARALRLSGRVEDALTVIKRRVSLAPRTANSQMELAAARRAVRNRLGS